MEHGLRIQSVSTSSDHVLHVIWSNGDQTQLNLTGWISSGDDILGSLIDDENFNRAYVSDYGLSIAWDDVGNIAIDAKHLRRIAEEQKPFDTADLLAWQASTGMSNNEAADFLDISLNTWKNYRSGAVIPRRFKMLLNATLRDPVLIHAHFRPRVAGRPVRVAG
jgi:hypothetical protein